MNSKTRLAWIRLYEETGDAGLVCRRCGISRPTLRKWWRRYQAFGQAGLVEQSRAPLRPAARKVDVEMEALILDLRRTRSLGVKRLRNELIRQHDLPLSLDTIHRVLVRTAHSILIRRASVVRAPRNIRVPSQVTACRWTSAKLRPGLIWATVDPKATDIEDRLAEWQHFWNWDRLHMALGGNTPIDHVCNRLAKTLLADEVEARYDLRRERIRIADYKVDMALVQLK